MQVDHAELMWIDGKPFFHVSSAEPYQNTRGLFAVVNQLLEEEAMKKKIYDPSTKARIEAMVIQQLRNIEEAIKDVCLATDGKPITMYLEVAPLQDADVRRTVKLEVHSNLGMHMSSLKKCTF